MVYTWISTFLRILAIMDVMWDLIILEQNANQEEDMQRKAGEHHEDGCLAKLS